MPTKTTLARLCFALLTIFSIFALQPAYADEITGEVTAVSDGDTIKVLSSNTIYKIRLTGIDCPEKSQDFGMKAKQFTSNLAFGKTVRVNFQKRDRYGRILGTVFLPDGTNLNEAILANGYAWWYQKYSPADGKLSQLEAKAKGNNEGLWSQPNPQAPWNYRKSKRHR